MNFLCSLTNKLRIYVNLPDDVNDFLSHITDLPDFTFILPVQALATGIFPVYLESDLHKWNIQSHLKTISVGLIKHAMIKFQKHIWLPRCTRNAEKENILGLHIKIKGTQHLFIPINVIPT